MIDVVIIGGGPSGISAGTVLQERGYRTCIIDAQQFPRKKLCAGVLTVKSVKLIREIFQNLDLESLSIRHVHKIKLSYKQISIGAYRINNAYSVVDRTEFDNALFQYYKRIGGLAYDGQQNYGIDYDKNIIRLPGGKEISYRFLIGADGINSRVRHYVSGPWKAVILCFEGFIPNVLKEDTIEINFGEILGGYSWRIPSQDRIGVGLGEFYIRGMKRFPQKYRKYFNNQGINNLEDIKGAFVSCGNFIRKPVKNNVLLVGDAAGLVDAMTGEGIFFAIESGKQAALAIIDQLEKGSSLTASYTGRLRKIHKKIREQKIYHKILYFPVLQPIVIRYLQKNPEFVKHILENAISTYYSGYTREIYEYNKR